MATTISTQQIQALLERAHAKHDPITPEALQAFMRHPVGPILPEECTRALRLPVGYGTRSRGIKPLPLDETCVHDIAISPRGDVWLSTVVKGACLLLNHKLLYGPPVHTMDECLEISVDDAPEGEHFVARFAGFKPDGTPVAACVQLEPTGNYLSDWSTRVFVGATAPYDGVLPADAIRSVRVAPSGDIITMHDTCSVTGGGKPTDERVVCRNGEEIWRGSELVRDAWPLADGSVAVSVFTNACDEVYRIHEDPPRVPTGSRAGVLVWTGSEGHRVEHISGDASTLRIITSHVGDVGNVMVHYVEDLGTSARVARTYIIGTNPYIGRAHELSNGRWAFVGVTREKLRCMVTSTGAGPGFRRVSNPHVVGRVSDPFVGGDVVRYYGALGRYLYEMEVPLAGEEA